MKKRILSIVFALCLCISSQTAVYAWQEGPLPQEGVRMGISASGLVARDSEIPAPAEVFDAMIALKDQDEYKEGTVWTDYEPYSDSKGYYYWKGGNLDGHRISAVGCVAFAFILSDAAFGNLPARMYASGRFAFEDIKTGDILRVNNDTHTVIVLEVNDAGVVVAEGNISTGDHKGKVHWGRAISKEEVMRNTSHYITRYPEGYIPPTDPDANVSIASGTLDGGLAWNLTKAGTMTISGKGAMPDYSSVEEQPWNTNSSQIKKIVIGDGVTGIGSCAFLNCGVLSVEISSGVTSIGNNAFKDSSLISVIIPSSVKTIGESAFRACRNLSLVTISEGVETIGKGAFRSCDKLASIALPASVGEIGDAAFLQCAALTSVTFAPGNKQVQMGDNMFTGCYYLMRVTLPKSINRIGQEMFQNCLLLAGVEIPQGAESIERSAFSSCSAFTTVIIPDSVTTIGIAAFTACPLKDVYFTGTQEQWNSINKMGTTASELSKATIHYNYVPPVSPAPGEGDDNNNGDNSGGNDNNNGDNPGGNSNNNGNNSGNDDDSGNGQNQTPFAEGTTFTIGENTYKVIKAGEEVELITSKSTAAKVTIDTITGTDKVKYKITSIGPKAMQNNKKLTNLSIGANVKTIGANAFKGCASLKKTLTLPDSIKTIGADAFSGCSKITAVNIGRTSKSSLTTIGKGAFQGCKKLGKATIRSTKLSSVGKQAFKGVKSGLKVKVPSKQLKKYRKILKKAGLKVKQITK